MRDDRRSVSRLDGVSSSKAFANRSMLSSAPKRWRGEMGAEISRRGRSRFASSSTDIGERYTVLLLEYLTQALSATVVL